MNNRSHLCRFIAEHPHDFSELLAKNYAIKSKQEGDLAIFNYSFDCRFEEPLVQEARGIILNVRTCEVVCWPFRKFGNHTEPYADEIDWSCARVLEKIDGSIVKLWFDRTTDHWQFSTNGMIRAEQAMVEDAPCLSYAQVIRRADNYAQIPFDSLDPSLTYIFELVSPDTRVLIKYDDTTLYHIGTRNNLTGEESETDIGIQKPRSFPLTSLADCLRAATELNAACTHVDEVEKEGFVVVDGHWNRVKIKSPDYVMMHRLIQVDDLSKLNCIELLQNDPVKRDQLCAANPPLVPVFKYYEYRLAELYYTADRIALLARRLFAEYSNDRGAVAKIIGKHPLAHVGFRALECDRTGREILKGYPIEKLVKLIPDYVREDLAALFR